MSQDADDGGCGELDALVADMRRRYTDEDPEVLAGACAVVVGQQAGSVDPSERQSALAALFELAWSASGMARTPLPGQAEYEAVLVAMLDDLYHGLLANRAEDGRTLLNAWLSVHAHITAAIFGAEKAAKVLSEAARLLPGAVENRDALAQMDALATHEAGRA